MEAAIRNDVLTNSIHIKIQNYINGFQMGLRVIEFRVSTQTSELAAQAVGVEVGQIAKTLLFLADGKPVLVVTSGDQRVDQKKLKSLLGVRKIKFADPAKVIEVTGYQVGGVCPLALPQPVETYLDESMLRYGLVYTAAGTASSALGVTVNQLEEITGGKIVDLA